MYGSEGDFCGLIVIVPGACAQGSWNAVLGRVFRMGDVRDSFTGGLVFGGWSVVSDSLAQLSRMMFRISGA